VFQEKPDLIQFLFKFVVYSLPTNELKTMKKFQLLNWVFIALMAFQFTSCEDEPLVGTFPQQENPSDGLPGAFTASINGVPFTANTISAVVFADGLFTIIGVNGSNNAITLSVPIVAEGNFILTDTPETDNFASYTDAQSAANPYTSASQTGGSGSMVVTSYDETELLISGSFVFEGTRQAADAQGSPIFDSSGDPIIQSVSITNGLFTSIPFTLDMDDGGDPGDGGGDGGDPTEPVEEFFANVDGVEHVDTSLTTTINMVGDEMIFKVEATTAAGALMRIDVPVDTGLGSFEMVSDISDGTKLIGIYNPNLGGENLSSNPGTITFTQFNLADGIMEATFSFTARDPLNQDPAIYQVTEGSFTVFFDPISLPPGVAFRAVVDGLEFLPDTTPVPPPGIADQITISSEEVNMVAVIKVAAIMMDGREMTLSFPKDIEVGMYVMGTEVVIGDEKVGAYKPAGTEMVFYSSPGTFTVQSYDLETGVMSATFSYNAEDPTGMDPTVRSVTEGEFNLTIPE
jgi:translation elongation factor EF-1beta